MTRTPEIRPDLGAGIDRKVLAQLRQRFLTVNQGRLERATEGFASRQQSVLRLLPLLFHVNHPLLPGYVSGFTPAGVSAYEPDDDVLAEAQRLTRSFTYKPRRGNAPAPILGLFLMGSLGSLAQDEGSDMDVWVCHAAGLPEEALDELQRKCQAIEAWAASLGAEAHFFLIDCERFVREDRDNKLSSDDSGTTQHYLLLDEFYRTAIWLAGRTPLWWLVPVYEEANYAAFTETLLSKRFIREQDVLDLGNLSRIPPGEYLGAGLWQLFKGLESPYKSLLKLLLAEVYADQHPAVQCVSLQLKQAVYAGQLNLDELDPYMMVYRRIEAYLLARGEHGRLELVRRSFYLKVNRKVSLVRAGRSIGWQLQAMQRLTAEWGWSEQQLRLLDNRGLWKVGQVTTERQALVSELNSSYRFLTRFSRANHTDNPASRKDLNVLGRRLYAAFERRAGKVEIINPGIAPNLAEDTVTLLQGPNRREPGKRLWYLYRGNHSAVDCEPYTPLTRSHELIELLAWCHRNGVIDASTRLALHPGESDLSEFELFNLLGALQRAVVLPMEAVSEAQLLQPAIPTEVLLLVNAGVDPLKHHREQNILMTTERTDSLSYAGMRDNLVLTLDQVTVNSWNEVMFNRYDGRHALLDCLRDYLNVLPLQRPAPQLRVCCFCHNRAQAISARVQELFDTATELLTRELGHRYLIQVEQQYHVLELNAGNVRHVPLPGLPVLLDYLARPLKSYSPLHLDAYALAGHELALILPHAHPDCVQVFYSRQGDEALVYVLDEFNGLWRQLLPFFNEASLLLPLQRFLQSVAYRREARMEMDRPATLGTLFYRITSSAGQPRAVERRQPPRGDGAEPFFEVQAILKKTADGPPRVTLFCNQREFSELEYGDRLYAEVAREILAQRRNNAGYRCYITDLDLSGLGGDQVLASNTYLRYKTGLEGSLNTALALL
ncbi:class I adenylate cyclase [Pseudomonas sp. RIT-PI-S]|uniref:class I adenylate cyclase n=1 Tax=Pseudomonas sp. RIT-PI-S TaxID=3035295 RepID=UPI0021D93E16|nr:class I adenylate cyclase [Pseudomonas sp. RIT-PI-S]